MNPLTVTFKLQLSEYKLAIRHHRRRRSKQRRPYRQLVFLGYASVAVGVLLLGTQIGSGWLAPLLLVGVGLFIPIRLTLAALDEVSDEWAESERLLQSNQWEFGDADIRITSALYAVQYQWAAFESWIETEEMFLLYQTAERCQVVPKRAFTSSEALCAFRELLREKFPKSVGGFPVVIK